MFFSVRDRSLASHRVRTALRVVSSSANAREHSTAVVCVRPWRQVRAGLWQTRWQEDEISLRMLGEVPCGRDEGRRSDPLPDYRHIFCSCFHKCTCGGFFSRTCNSSKHERNQKSRSVLLLTCARCFTAVMFILRPLAPDELWMS